MVSGRCSWHGKGHNGLRRDEKGGHKAIGEIEGFGGYSAPQRGEAGWCWAGLGTRAPRGVPARLVLLQQLPQFLQLRPADVGASTALAEGLQEGLERQVLGEELLYLCLWDRWWDSVKAGEPWDPQGSPEG